jgi:hypothetical protein
MLGALGFAAPAYAGQAPAKGDAIVVRSLSFFKVDDLEFGSMIASATAGTVVVDPFGARTKTGGVTLVGGLVQPSSFAGRGANNQSVQISLGANSIQLTRVSGTQKMTVDTFIIGSTPTAQLTTNPRVFVISSATGIFTFPVGATLRVGANQTAGNYVGTFSITLVYP